MKKLIVVLALSLILTGCGVFERGNYDKDRSGYILKGDYIVNFHTNSIGEIDVFMIDKVMSYFDALEYTSFDYNRLSDETTFNNVVTEVELLSCSITSVTEIPRFIRIEERSFFFNVRDNGYCTYDEYDFHETGFTDEISYDVEDVSPVENLNVTIFSEPDFYVNSFETIIYVENISYHVGKDEWEKTIVTVLPMSLRQAGNMYQDNSDFFEELAALEYYVLENQSVNLLELREDFMDETVNNIWSEETIDRLGRDHEVIKTVRSKETDEILTIIEDALTRLGMFS